MGSDDSRLNDKTVDELRDEARRQGLSGASDMKKDELVSALSATTSGSGTSLAGWLRDRSLGLFFLTLFLVSWLGQLVAQWFNYVNEQQDHAEPATFWSGDFWANFWEATLENWQSEFLQLATFTIAAAYLVYKGSSESADSDERIEQKLDALLEERGIDPQTIEQGLPPKHRQTVGA